MKKHYHERDYTYGAAMYKLRTAIGLTQAGLAKELGVVWRTVAGWEAGSSYIRAEQLKALITLGVRSQAFTQGSEASEIRAFWKVSQQRTWLDERWLSLLLTPQESSAPAASLPAEEHVESSPPSSDLPVSQIQPSQDETSVEDQPTPKIHNLPFPPNPFFTGRESELLLIAQLFENNERVSITQPISVSGLGGIGKTQLVLEYAHRNYPHIYHSVFFINATDLATLSASFLSLAQLLRLPEQQEREMVRVMQAVKHWLEEHSHWLLILDNTDNLEQVSTFLPSKPRGHILLTTRSQIVGNLSTLIQLEAMSAQEGLVFLLRRSGILRSMPQENIPTDQLSSATALVSSLAGHPLALDQAGAYIEESEARLADYQQLYQQEHRQLLLRRGFHDSGHPDTVATTLQISMTKACKLYPRCADVLAFCALLHPDAIPEELLRQKTGLNLDLLTFNEVMAALRKYSLIKRDREHTMLSMHRLVQTVLKDEMDTQSFRQWCEHVVRAVNTAFPDGTDFERWSQCERLLPQALICLTWIEGETIMTSQAASLLHKAGMYIAKRGQYTQAHPLLQRALTIREQCMGAEHPDTAISLDTLAELYRQQGKYSLAEPLYQRALTIQEQYSGAEHPDTARIINHLALLHWHLGRYQQAEPLYCRTIAIYEQHFSEMHPCIADSLNNLALLYQQQGRYQQAEPLFQRALAIREQSLEASHPDIAVSLNNLALLYKIQGRYQQAEQLFQRALAIRERSLGAEHPETAAGLDYLAQLYHKQGRYQQAEQLFQRALAIHEQSLGGEHIDTGRDLNNLACLYREQGRYQQAEPLAKRALTIYELRLGSEHPRTTYPMHELAEIYQGQGKYEQAEPLFQRALTICEQRLGAEHRFTAEVLSGLAELYRQQGKHGQAEPIYKRALHIREQCLGPDHPDTQKLQQQYASLQKKMGCHAES